MGEEFKIRLDISFDLGGIRKREQLLETALLNFISYVHQEGGIPTWGELHARDEFKIRWMENGEDERLENDQ